jgi:hypothetical protein
VSFQTGSDSSRTRERRLGDHYAAEGALLALDRTFVITTRPFTFSVTFQLISTFRPPAIACRAIRNNAIIATITTAGHASDCRTCGALLEPAKGVSVSAEDCGPKTLTDATRK